MEIFFFYCIWNFHADEELYVSSLGGIVDVKYTVCLFICFLIGNFFFPFSLVHIGTQTWNLP